MSARRSINYPSGSAAIWFGSGAGSVALRTEFFGAPVGGGDAGYLPVWMGAAYVRKPAKTWTGAAWVIKPAKDWTGATWSAT